MKSQLVLFATWLNSDSNRIKALVVAASIALALAGAGSHVAQAGPIPGGSDVIRP
jgi:hypothetical protein